MTSLGAPVVADQGLRPEGGKTGGSPPSAGLAADVELGEQIRQALKTGNGASEEELEQQAAQASCASSTSSGRLRGRRSRRR